MAVLSTIPLALPGIPECKRGFPNLFPRSCVVRKHQHPQLLGRNCVIGWHRSRTATWYPNPSQPPCAFPSHPLPHPCPKSFIWCRASACETRGGKAPLSPTAHSLISLLGSEIQIFTTPSRNRGINGSLWSITVRGRNAFLWVGDSSAGGSPAFLAAGDYAAFASC